MPERTGSADSFDEFFSASKANNEEKTNPQEEFISPSAGIAALIKSQPVVHHRSNNSEAKREYKLDFSKHLICCVFPFQS